LHSYKLPAGTGRDIDVGDGKIVNRRARFASVFGSLFVSFSMNVRSAWLSRKDSKNGYKNEILS
jgi:hypothetical protein